MSRLKGRFEELEANNKTALVIYLTSSDPDLEMSVAAGLEAVRAGADVLEVGVPFSDPVADGPTIQRAMYRALEHGGGFDAALEVVRRIRAETDIPIVLFGYLNPLLWRTFETSCELAAAAGVDGMLVVDLPP